MDWAKRLAELQAQRAAIQAEMTSLVEAAETAKRGLKPEEQTTFNAKREDIRSIDERIKNAESILAEARAKAAAAPVVPAPQPAPTPADGAPGATPRVQVIPNGREHLPFKNEGEFFLAVRSYHIEGKYDERFDVIRKAAEERATASGFNITIPSDGGVLLQSDQASGLLKTAADNALFYGKGTRLPLSAGSQIMKLLYIKDRDRSGGSVTGGLRWYTASEAQDYQASKLSFLRVSMELKKVTGLAFCTDELVNNVGALVGVINQGFRTELSSKLDQQVAFGNGNDEGTGFLTAANKALITVAAETGQDADTILAMNVNKMRAKFKAANGIWCINQEVDMALPFMQFDPDSTVPIPVYMPANGIAGQTNGVLYGRPVVQTDLAAAHIGDLDDIFLVDPSAHYYIDQGDIDFQSSLHVRFLQGEQAFRFTYFFDCRPTEYDKMIGRNGDTTSSYVNLAAR